MSKSEKKKRPLSIRVLIALVIGIILGLIVHSFPSGTIRDAILIDGIFQLIGQIFLRAIMMCVVPLVFISLVNGAASMGDVKKLGRIGIKTVVFYMATTAVAVVLALVLGFVLKPGIGLDLGSIESIDVSASESTSLVQTLFEMVPRNPIQAMAEGNMLQIIVFAILVGIAISVLGDKAKKVQELFVELNELVMKLVTMIMNLAPIGVLCLVGRTFGQMGIAVLIPLAKFIFTVYLGLVIHAIFTYGGIFKGIAGLSLTRFYKKFYPAMLVAFSTASSNATVPVSLDICENDLGVSKDVAAFTIPLGATINMDGTAIYQGVAAFFIAQVYGIQMTLGMAATIVLTATLASIGTAGVPGAGTIMLSMVLQSVGLPMEGIGLIMGIERIADMGRTSLNITGDALCTTIVAKQEGEWNEEIWNSDREKEVV